MLTGMYLRENGKMIRLMGMEFTRIWMELNTKGHGKKIGKMEME